MEKEILIVCGEPSGDLHAKLLVKAIKEIEPNIKFFGVGGNYLGSENVEIIYHINEITALGLFEVIRKLPKFFYLKKLLLQKIKEKKPHLIILVDFSGFNLRFAKSLKRKIPVIYYISPQVWASRKGRIKTIKKYVNKIIVFFRFEEKLYRNYEIDVNWVGSPLLDIVKPNLEKEEFFRKFNLQKNKLTFAVLAGSRGQEIKYNLVVMLKAISIVKEKIPNIQVIVVKTPFLELNLYQKFIKKFKDLLDINIIEAQTYNCINYADFALVASGTATLETAILEKPFVIIYKMNILNYLFYRPQVKLPYIGMVNIIAGKKIIPEFIQFKATPKRIAQKVLEILETPNKLEEMKNSLKFIKKQLGEKGAILRAAKTIVNFLNTN
ncbi:MAG: lipid-A-disaccharide synthase [Candidatus Aenigmatarchaeota archaeon]